MTPFAIVGTVYLILLAICFAVSAASLAVIAWKLNIKRPDYIFRYDRDAVKTLEVLFSRKIPVTSWPTKNGKSVEHGEG